MKTLLRIIFNKYILNKKEKYFFLLLLLMIVGTGFIEVFLISSFFPFISSLLKPNSLVNQELTLVRFLANLFNLELNTANLGLIFSSIVILAAAFRLITTWMNFQFSALVGSNLSTRLYLNNLSSPYEKQISINSSEVITTVLKYVDHFSKSTALIVQVLSSVVSFIGIAYAMIRINPSTLAIAFSIIGITYLLIAFKVKNKIIFNGRKLLFYEQNQLRVLQEGVGSVRDVVLNSSYNYFAKEFYNLNYPLRKLVAENSFLSIFPKYFIEAFGIICITGLLAFSNSGSSLNLAIFGTFALGAQRLLPYLQQLFSSWAQIRGYKPSLEKILLQLNSKDVQKKEIYIQDYKKIKFRNLTLTNVSYRYPNSKKWVLKNLDFSIKKGERIGIVGSSGGGKSTFVDIISGLLIPQNGKVSVNGNDINSLKNKNELIFSWRGSVSYVPQQIYLSDNTISHNIAYGDSKPNLKRIIFAAKMSNLNSFIETLPDKYNTLIGERGASLSGGQCQRIGIARALYKNANFLILDEATSALDLDNQEIILSNIYEKIPDMTIITIAHRKEVLVNCDKIYKISDSNIFLL